MKPSELFFSMQFSADKWLALYKAVTVAQCTYPTLEDEQGDLAFIEKSMRLRILYEFAKDSLND